MRATERNTLFDPHTPPTATISHLPRVASDPHRVKRTAAKVVATPGWGRLGRGRAKQISSKRKGWQNNRTKLPGRYIGKAGDATPYPASLKGGHHGIQ